MKKHFKVFGNIIFLISIFFLCQFVTGIVLFFIFALLNSGISLEETISSATEFITTNTSLLLIFSSLLSFLIYYFTLKDHKLNLIERCNFNKVSGTKIIKTILFSIGICMILSIIVGMVSQYFPSYANTSEMLSSSSTSIMGFIAIVLVAPIFEEILFRGLVLFELRKNLNVWLAVVLQAIIFGICHFNSLQTLYAALLGALLGLIYVKTKSILASMVSHATFNLFGSIVLPFIFSKAPDFALVYLIVGILISVTVGISLFKECNLESSSDIIKHLHQ